MDVDVLQEYAAGAQPYLLNLASASTISGIKSAEDCGSIIYTQTRPHDILRRLPHATTVKILHHLNICVCSSLVLLVSHVPGQTFDCPVYNIRNSGGVVKHSLQPCNIQLCNRPLLNLRPFLSPSSLPTGDSLLDKTGGAVGPQGAPCLPCINYIDYSLIITAQQLIWSHTTSTFRTSFGHLILCFGLDYWARWRPRFHPDQLDISCRGGSGHTRRSSNWRDSTDFEGSSDRQGSSNKGRSDNRQTKSNRRRSSNLWGNSGRRRSRRPLAGGTQLLSIQGQVGPTLRFLRSTKSLGGRHKVYSRPVTREPGARGPKIEPTLGAFGRGPGNWMWDFWMVQEIGGP